jgi:four helix bundle protein
MFNYEKLETWQEAVVFADLIYSTTRKFPNEQRFGLTNQMRRAAVSISSNLAEGSSRNSRNDFARFVEIATGSVFEIVSQASIAQKRGFLSDDDFKNIYTSSEKLGRMPSGLRHSFLKSN